MQPFYDKFLEAVCDTSVSMSDNDIQYAKQVISAEQRRRNNSADDVTTIYFWEQTPAEIRAERMIACREQATSAIVYGTDYDFVSKNGGLARYGLPFTRKLETTSTRIDTARREAYALTTAEVIALYKAQKERISKAVIHQCVHTDFEGCSYNSIEWDART